MKMCKNCGERIAVKGDTCDICKRKSREALKKGGAILGTIVVTIGGIALKVISQGRFGSGGGK